VDTKEFSATRLDLFNLELAGVFGPLSCQAEMFYSLPGVESEGTHRFWGYYVLGSVFLTGEHRPHKKSEGIFARVKTNHDFRPLQGGWGAWEVTGRISFADLNDKSTRRGKEFNFTLGVNGHLASYLQIMFNYIRAIVEDRATNPALNRGRANIFQGRVQVAF
jgi:phosphate-selective porin OprO/OprP